MAVIIEHFESLRERFPEWPALKDYLTSKVGGSIRVVESETNYVILRYVKGESNFMNSGTGLFRSVVWDTINNCPVCFSPPKAKDGIPPIHTTFTTVEDFMDGCMIQAFVTSNAPEQLQLATRTLIGANNRFYSEKSFSELFAECLAATPIRTFDAVRQQLCEFMAQQGPGVVAAFGSFVIQHPEHRVVAKNKSPDAHMVHLGFTTNSGKINVFEQSSQWPVALRRLQVPRYPIKLFHTEEEIHDLVRRTTVQNGFCWQGLVFKDGTGTRWRIRSPSYTMLRTLRGSEATPIERFLRLRKDGNVIDYLKHYNEERATFWDFEQVLRSRTNNCADAYNAVHKLHIMKFAELPAAYKPVVHLLHVEYLEKLRQNKETVRLKNAIDAVNSLKAFEQRRLMDSAEFIAPLATATATVAADDGVESPV